MYQTTICSELYSLLSKLDRVSSLVFTVPESVQGGRNALDHLKYAAEQIKSYIDVSNSNPWNIHITEFVYAPIEVNRNINYHALKCISGDVTIILCDYGITNVWGEVSVIAIEIQYSEIGLCATGKIFSYAATWNSEIVQKNINTWFELAYRNKPVYGENKRIAREAAAAELAAAAAKSAADAEKTRVLAQKRAEENERRMFISKSMDPFVPELRESLSRTISHIQSLNDDSKRNEAFVYAARQLALLSYNQPNA
jgi:hypothetical protein